MAVFIDTVYQRVLALANKEQRGYITPQEFNLLANQAQLLIFESYFTEIDIKRRTPGNSIEYSDPLNSLEEKISPFDNYKVAVAMSGNTGTLNAAIYKLGTVYYAVGGTTDVVVNKVTKSELAYIERSPIAAPTVDRPVYFRQTDNTIRTFPATTITSNVTCNYVSIPTTAEWGYVVVNDEAAYNASATTNFMLHESEESILVIKILELAGIVMNKEGIVKIADQEEKDIKLEKNK